MNKYVIAVMVVFAMLLCAGGLPALMASVQDFKTTPATQTFIVSTVSSNSTVVQLSRNMWNADITTGLTVASNTTVDVPVSSSYDDTTRSLTINGLATNTTRNITVNYLKDGLTNYTGASTAINLVPTLIVVSIISVAITVCVFLWIK